MLFHRPPSSAADSSALCRSITGLGLPDLLARRRRTYNQPPPASGASEVPGNLAARAAQLASSSARSRAFIYTGSAGAALPTSHVSRTSTAGDSLLTLSEPTARAPG